jgi:protein NirF
MAASEPDGRIVAAQTTRPASSSFRRRRRLYWLADIPPPGPDGPALVGLADGRPRFSQAFSTPGEILDRRRADPGREVRYPILASTNDGLVTPDGRWYLAGLFGEDGLALVDLWHPERGAKRVLPGYGRGEEKLPVYKMPHLRGWAIAGGYAWLPAIGATRCWSSTRATGARSRACRSPASRVRDRAPGCAAGVGQLRLARQRQGAVIDAETRTIAATLAPGRAVLHLEFAPRGEEVWISARDDDRVVVIDTATLATVATLPADSPSGIFFTSRAARMGF